MIEAMACGTPVLAFDRGSVSEIIEDGKTGIVVQSKDEAIKKLPHLLTLDRRRIRHEFERRFSAQRMAHDHVGLYQELIRGDGKSLQCAFQSDALGNAQQADQSRSAIQ
jgi:glycosyltransferase involved in cell wall biosynthesis